MSFAPVRPRLPRALGVLAVLAIGACETSERDLAEAGVASLDAEAARTLLSGNTARIDGDGWVFHGYYAPDGTLRGHDTWEGGTRASGVWEVNKEGLACRDWDNDWGGGGYGCSAVYPTEKAGEYLFFHRTGSAGTQRRFEVTMLEGNPEGL